MKKIIKNIFWDADGVLDDLNFAYYNFLTNHPNYKEMYGTMKWEDLPKVLPIVPEYGALELKTHPTLGKEMDIDFCHTPEFFTNRPLYPNVVDVLRNLNQKGYKQFTMSATFDVETKRRFLNNLLHDVTDFLTIECVQHKQFMHDSAKEDMLKFCCEKYGLKAEETVLVDDRVYNIDAASKAGVNAVRMRCEFTTPIPDAPEYAHLKDVPEVSNILEFQDWLLNNTVME